MVTDNLLRISRSGNELTALLQGNRLKVRYDKMDKTRVRYIYISHVIRVIRHNIRRQNPGGGKKNILTQTRPSPCHDITTLIKNWINNY